MNIPEVDKLKGQRARDKLLALLRKKEIPRTFDRDLRFLPPGLEPMNEVYRIAGYTMLAEDWIAGLSEWIGQRKVLEVGAGTGALTYCLRQKGADIAACDNGIYTNCGWGKGNPYWIDDLYKGDAAKIISPAYDLVLMGYPTKDGMAAAILRAMRKKVPEAKLVYIGPFNAAYTGDDFSDIAITIDDSGLAALPYEDWAVCDRLQASIKLIG